MKNLVIRQVIKGGLGDVRYVIGSIDGIHFSAGWRPSKYKFHISSSDLNNRQKGVLSDILKEELFNKKDVDAVR